MLLKLGIASLALLSSSAQAETAPPARSKAEAIAARMADPDGGLVIVAHRGCHNAAPENSFAALEACVALGVDAVEIDIRRTRDGHLVLMHDDKIDRTTDGSGKLSALTLDQVRNLRLRQGQGGPGNTVTAERVVTLDEMLQRAGDRIMLCLDIKEGIQAEVIAAVRRAGATRRVFIQPGAALSTVPLASTPPYDGVPIFPSIMASQPWGSDLAQVLINQSAGARIPWGYALPWSGSAPVIGEQVLPQLVEAARAVRGRLFANTMAKGTFVGFGGDDDAVGDPDAAWGQLYRAGVTMFQTDQPEALAAFRKTLADHDAGRRPR